MFVIKVQLTQIDYNSVVRFSLPIARKGIQNMDFEQFMKIAIDDLMAVDDSKIENALSIVPDSIKTLMIMKIFSSNCEKIETAMNSFVESKGMKLRIHDLNIDNRDSKSDFLINCALDGVDYKNIIQAALPLIHLDEAGGEMNQFLNALFKAMNSEHACVESIIDAMGNNFIDDFIRFLLNHYSDFIKYSLEGIAKSKDISFSLDSIDIELV